MLVCYISIITFSNAPIWNIYNHKSSLLYSQQSATCPYPSLIKSIPRPPILFLYDPLQYYSPIHTCISKYSPVIHVSHQNQYTFLFSPVRVTRPAHPILLDLIARTILARNASYEINDRFFSERPGFVTSHH